MDDNGRFSAKEVRPRSDLSATENTLLQYFCFLEANRFRNEVQKAMGRTVQKPLFIGALADNIDFCIDLVSLLTPALGFGRQVLLFARGKNIEEYIMALDKKLARKPADILQDHTGTRNNSLISAYYS